MDHLAAAPLVAAPLAWPETMPAPSLAARPARADGGEPRAVVLLVEIEFTTIEPF